ncbi:hypothetical protein [Roseateles violae]|uniref:Uncharacterized protein n=1 Tax=Roseateles violae TaxID=3058042 RepID=A0ABT8DUA6_9BURK|nr:hypothetical protein [Pelomonas sp. PFR6]MDN3920494.1 hypothetical protein [Pelomonas sp. PFR6]
MVTRQQDFLLEDWNLLFDAVCGRLAEGLSGTELQECLQALEQLQSEAAMAIVRLEAALARAGESPPSEHAS